MNKLKVALLFAGQPRFITNPYPFASHKREILDKYDVTTFSHCWFDKEATQFSYNEWSRMDDCPVNPAAIDIIKEKYNPVLLHVDKPRDFALSEESRNIIDRAFPNNPVFNARNVGNALSYLYSLEEAVGLFEKFCEYTKEVYDFIIISRFDSIVYRLPDLHSLNKETFYLSNHHPAFPDLMFICGQKYVKGFKCFSNADSIIQSGGLLNPNSFGEQIKGINMMNHCRKMWLDGDKSGSVQQVPLPVRIVRDLNNKGDEDQLWRYGLTDAERFLT